MPETMPKQRFYFRKTDPRDQGFYRLLMRYRGVARTALFREIVMDGYLRYIKKQEALRRRAKNSNGSPPDTRKPITATRPSEPW